MIAVSVIVPVYNVERYLRRCLDSLVKQKLGNIEIIIVNDGSKDNSQEIINEYLEKYSNIYAYVKDNTGISDTRNFGIEKATGEYVAFVDSDDFVELDMYQKMYEKAKTNNFDIVVCDFFEVYSNHRVRGYSNLDVDIIDNVNIKKSMINCYPSPWNKLYKRCLLKDVPFKKGVWAEDVEMLYRLFPKINSIGVIKEPYYHYVQRDDSISKSVDPRIYHIIDNWNSIIEYYQSNGILDEYFSELEYCYVRYLFATFTKAAVKFEKEEYQNAIQYAIQNVKEKFPYYKKNYYLNQKGLKNLYLKYFNQLFAMIYFKIKH